MCKKISSVRVGALLFVATNTYVTLVTTMMWANALEPRNVTPKWYQNKYVVIDDERVYEVAAGKLLKQRGGQTE